MSAARSPTADIGAAIVRGQWWLRLFRELFQAALACADAWRAPSGGPSRSTARLAARIDRAARLTMVASRRLAQILTALAELRQRSPADIAAAQAAARARAAADAAAREQVADRAAARLEASESERPDRDDAEDEEDFDEEDFDDFEDEDFEDDLRALLGRLDKGSGDGSRDLESLVKALDRRLAAVDPALVDFDDLHLRETVLQICADLGITPDWARWEAGDWARRRPPAPAAVSAPPPTPDPQPARAPKPPVLPGLPGSAPRPTAMTPFHGCPAGRPADEWRPRLE